MENFTLRQEAIRRHLAGESVTAICRELNKSRKWFYKWYNRYLSGIAGWYQDQSKAPKHQPRKIDEKIEQLVLQVRDQLEQTKYAQIGATAIGWHIYKLGDTPPPVWSINRILKRNGKIQPKKKRKKSKSNIAYRWFTEPSYPGHIYQTDLIGPRYVKGDGRFYCLSTIDCFTHLAYCVAMRAKDDDSIVKALLTTWHHIGMPYYQQFDNELSFQGSNRYPHSFGKVLKLCLAAGVQPIFIPIGEPWRNGIVEHFNGTFENCFYRVEHFANFEHLKEQLIEFIIFHNENHVYSTNRGKSPNQILKEQEIKIEKLGKDFQFSENHFLPDDSFVHFIRFIRSDLKLNIRGESFPMPKETMYQYVRATIFTKWNTLNIFSDEARIAGFAYPLPNFNQENPELVIKMLERYINKLKM